MGQKKEIIELKEKFDQHKRQTDLQYEKDVNQVKYFNESNAYKIQNALKLEAINKVISQKNDELVDLIKNFNENERKKMIELELVYENKMNDMKKRMLSYLNVNSKNKLEINEIENKIRGNLFVMKHDRLIEELEFQSLEIEDLLKQREQLDMTIFSLKNDIKVHENIERNLMEKNRQYIEMIKILGNKIDEKINQEKALSKLPGFNETNTVINASNNYNSSGRVLNSDKTNNLEIEKTSEKNFDYKINDKFLYTGYTSSEENEKNEDKNVQKNSLLIKDYKEKNYTGYKNEFVVKVLPVCYSKINNLKTKKSNDKTFRSSSAETFNCTPKLNNIELNRQLKQKTKELENYRNKYETARDKLSMINSKYSNILKLFENALLEIYNSNSIENLNVIYTNLSDFSHCDFDKMTSQQKFSVLILLVKYIIPLINEEQISEVLKSTLNNVNTKLYISDCGDTSSTRTSKNMWGYSVVKGFNKTNYKVKCNLNFKRFKNYRNNSTKLSINQSSSCSNLFKLSKKNAEFNFCNSSNFKTKFNFFNKNHLSNINKICNSLVNTEIENTKKNTQAYLEANYGNNNNNS